MISMDIHKANRMRIHNSCCGGHFPGSGCDCWCHKPEIKYVPKPNKAALFILALVSLVSLIGFTCLAITRGNMTGLQKEYERVNRENEAAKKIIRIYMEEHKKLLDEVGKKGK